MVAAFESCAFAVEMEGDLAGHLVFETKTMEACQLGLNDLLGALNKEVDSNPACRELGWTSRDVSNEFAGFYSVMVGVYDIQPVMVL